MKTFSRLLLLFMFLLIALAGFMFIRYNQDLAGLWLPGISFQPRAAGQWYLLFFIVGGVAGLACGLGLYRQLRNRMKLIALENRIRKLDEENKRLRNALPTQGPASET